MSAMDELPMVAENALSDDWVLNHWKTQLITIINSDNSHKKLYLSLE